MTDTIVYRQINKDHAYWSEKRQFGQVSGGNTAGLLTHYHNGQVIDNVLFDAGCGTIDGLCDAGFSWTEPLTVFITHAHIDHHAELMLLSELWCKRSGVQGRGPLRVYCTGGDEHGIKGTVDYLKSTHAWAFGGGRSLTHVPISSDASVVVGIFTITTIDVDHFPGAVIYVIEFGPHKIVIGWDMKTLPDPEVHKVLQHPSLALFEANTWTSLSSRTGHTSVVELVQSGFLERLQLSKAGQFHFGAWLVHFSGAEDPDGPIADGDLESKLRKTYSHLSDLVGVARRGQQWVFEL